jgi:hypothetical protein
MTTRWPVIMIYHLNVSLCAAYNAMYIIEPGGSVNAEAMPDALGLKIGLVYDANPSTKEIFFVRFTCKNDSVLNVSEMLEDDVSWYGGRLRSQLCNFWHVADPSYCYYHVENIEGYAKGKLKEATKVPFEMALSAIQNRAVNEKMYSTYSQPSGSTPANNSNNPYSGVPPPPAQQGRAKPVTSNGALGHSSTHSTSSNVSNNSANPSQPKAKTAQSAASRNNPYAVQPPAEVESAQEKWDQKFKHIKEISTEAETKLARQKIEQATKARHAHEAILARQELEREEARREQERLEQEERERQQAEEEERERQLEEERQRQIEEEEQLAALKKKKKHVEEDDEEDDDNTNKKKGKGKTLAKTSKTPAKSTGKKKGKKEPEPEDEEEEEEDDGDEDDMEDSPSKKKPSKKGKGKKNAEQVDTGCTCSVM